MVKRFVRTGNRIAVALYGSTGGRLVGGGDKVLLLTVPGRRTGLPRSTCMRFLDVPEGLLVWGTGSGAREDPDWVRNLRHVQEAHVQVGRRSLQARVRELRGQERERAWRDVVVTRLPGVERYARKSGRVIPVFVLEPVA